MLITFSMSLRRQSSREMGLYDVKSNPGADLTLQVFNALCSSEAEMEGDGSLLWFCVHWDVFQCRVSAEGS